MSGSDSCKILFKKNSSISISRQSDSQIIFNLNINLDSMEFIDKNISILLNEDQVKSNDKSEFKSEKYRSNESLDHNEI